MDVAARLTSKGQVTIPKAVRDALELNDGDAIIFRIEGTRAIVARTPDFLEFAGKIRIPESKKNTAWDHALRNARAQRAGKDS
jgi:AbrB family looped-hinge helix DNA binding protein